MYNPNWYNSMKAAQNKAENEKNNIFWACYTKNEKELDNAIVELKNAERAVDGWKSWIVMNDNERMKTAQEKARSACIKFADRIGKSPVDVLQFVDDAANDAIIYIYYDMDATERAPESILSYIAGKYISSYYYRSAGRNGKDESMEEYENIDAFLYGKNVFGPGPEAALLANDTKEEILLEVKSKYRYEAAIIIDMLSDGYTQEEIAAALSLSQQVISYRLQQIKAAARIVEENNRRDSLTEKQIESDENALYNMAIRKSWKRK